LLLLEPVCRRVAAAVDGRVECRLVLVMLTALTSTTTQCERLHCYVDAVPLLVWFSSISPLMNIVSLPSDSLSTASSTVLNAADIAVQFFTSLQVTSDSFMRRFTD